MIRLNKFTEETIMYEHPINNITLFINLKTKDALEYLKQSGFRWVAKVQKTKHEGYTATTHPLLIDYNYQEDDMIKSILPKDFEPLEFQLKRQEIEQLKKEIETIKEVLGCNYVQLRNKELLANYLSRNGFGKQDKSNL